MHRPDDQRSRIIVALDVRLISDAIKIAEELAGEVGGFKIGLELLTSEGAPRVVSALSQLGVRIFYDGKFNDIPNTVGAATKAVADLGVWMLDVHASSGIDALRACVHNKASALAVAVTVLTSLGDDRVADIFGAPPSVKVLRFARLAVEAGMDGVVCSPHELLALKEHREVRDLLTVVPGVRPSWAAAGDQARVMTPSDAVRQGADYIVVGRPILAPPPTIGNRKEAASRIREDLAEQ